MNALTARKAGQRFDAAILLPDPAQLSDPHVVASEPMEERRRYVSQRIGGESAYRVWRPSRDPEEVFPKLGVAVEHGTMEARPRTGGRFGVAQRLANLGGYIVTWPRGDDRIDTLRDAFGADFAVARDYRIFQKSEVDDGDGAASAQRNAWPDSSGIALARQLNVDGKNIRFGIVDTGIDADHAEFNRRLVPFAHVPYREDEPASEGRRGFDPSNHGTHISSIIAGREVGIAHAGRAYVAGIGEGRSTTTHLRRLVRGLDWLYGAFLTGNNKGQPIILNFSLGFPEDPPDGEDAEEYAVAIRSLEGLVEATLDATMLLVAAIGNDGEGRYRLPGGLPGVLGVGAVDRDGEQIMRFSGNVPGGLPDGRRVGPDMVGFGQSVLGADGRNTAGDSLYARWSGTSQASAYVSGIAGLYWSMDRRMRADDVRALLSATAMPPPRGEDRQRWGAGLARFAPPAELLKTWEGG